MKDNSNTVAIEACHHRPVDPIVIIRLHALKTSSHTRRRKETMI